MSGPAWIEVHLADLFARVGPYPIMAVSGSYMVRRWEARVRKGLRRLDGWAVFAANGSGWIITSFSSAPAAAAPWFHGRIDPATWSAEAKADLRFWGVEPDIAPDGWHRRVTPAETRTLAARGRQKRPSGSGRRLAAREV